MESEHLQNFNERLSQWVASQGFWFQIRYSMAGSGMRGRAMFHLLRMGVRVLVFLLVVAAGIGIYLVKRTDSERFNETMEKGLQSGLSASDMEIRGLSRVQGELEISRLAAEGGDETFFSTLEARNVRCKMGLVDGLMGIWRPGIISISKLDVELRAGTDDADSALKLAESVFGRSEKVELSAFEVSGATLRWGYSERTQGMIEGSQMKVQRTETGWRMLFKGGRFYQNWLRGLDIVTLEVLCEPEGLVFEKAELSKGGGTVDFSGLRVLGGERPEVKGVARLRGMAIEDVVPAALRSFLEGTISGDFRVFGSMNSADGIGFESQIVLDGKEVISLRERIHILKALSVVDYSRNYHRIDFREGSFQVKINRGGIELKDVNLKADDLFTLEGNLTVRLPTPEEIQEWVARGAGAGSPIFAGDDEYGSEEEMPQAKSDFSLKRAAQEERRSKEGDKGLDSSGLFEKLGMSADMRRLQSQESERMSRMLRYDGMFRITVPGDAFERAGLLQQLYPVDPTTGRIPVGVPLEGSLWDLTLKQAEDIYQQGRR